MVRILCQKDGSEHLAIRNNMDLSFLPVTVKDSIEDIRKEMGNAGGLLRKNIRTTQTPQGTKFSTIPVHAIQLGDRKLAYQLVVDTHK